MTTDTAERVADIGQPPWENVSNFNPYTFVFRGVECASIEGLLQSTKCKDPEVQLKIVKLHGIKAKRKGQKKKWWLTKTLYWLGQPMHRHSDEYQSFISDAYHELYHQNSLFREALKKTGELKLVHTVGKTDPNFTILTELEFVTILNTLRKTITLHSEKMHENSK